MSSNIGSNFNNKINGRPNPFSKGAKTTTSTRALGSSTSIFVGPNGWRGAARGANPYDTQSMNAARYARMRAGANVYAGRNTGSFGALAQQSGANDMDTLSKVMMYTQLGMMGAELVKGIVDIFKSPETSSTKKAGTGTPAPGTKTSGTPAPGTETLGTQAPGATTVKSASAAAISSMESANDSASLAAAISNAQVAATDLESSIDTIGKEIESLKGSYESAKGQIAELTEKVSTAKGNYTLAQSTVKQKENAVKSYEQSLASAEQTLRSSDESFNAAAGAYDTARQERQTQDGVVSQLTTSVATLEGQLAATPKTLPDGTTPNPAYASLESQLNAKKQELSNAKTRQGQLVDTEAQKLQEKQTALNNLDASKAGVADAKRKATTAQDNLTKADGELKTAKEAFEQKEVELKKAEGDLKQQQDIISDYETKQGSLSDKQDELKDLHKKIDSQQDRLERLKRAEEKDASRLERLQRRQNKLEQREDNLWNRAVKGTIGEIRESRIENLQEKIAGTSTLSISSGTLDVLNDAGVMLDDDDATALLGHSIKAGTDGTFEVDGEIKSEADFNTSMKEINAELAKVRADYYNSAVATVTVNGKSYDKVGTMTSDGMMYNGINLNGKTVNLKTFIRTVTRNVSQ